MKSTRDGDLIGDSGTYKWTSTAAIPTATAPTTNSQCERSMITREHQPEAAADREHGRDRTDGDTHLLGRELVLDDREAEREDCGASTLKDPAADEDGDVRREDRRHAAGEEDQEADEEQPLLSVLVSQSPEQGSRH
jgi:hypothetical protein